MLSSKPKLLTLVIASTLLTTACNESTSSSAGSDYNRDRDTNTSFNQQALIANLTDNVITPTFEQFVTESDKQTQAIIQYCTNEKAFAEQQVEQQVVTDSLNAAQAQWQIAMGVWQQAEMMQLGPLKDQDGALRNKIYSWPVTNSCAVDYDVMFYLGGTVNGQPYDIALRTPSRKGMAALEYLLFNDSNNHSCGSETPPNWASLSEAEVKVARCNFAQVVASDINNNADTLLASWTATDGFANELKQAGTQGNSFATEHAAVNEISDAMFYLDTRTKDGKIATPLGLFDNDCGSVACVDSVESPYANQSYQHIVNNLIAFEKLLTGADGIGFIDYLIDVGDTDTATTMASDVSTAINNISALDNSLVGSINNDISEVEQSHADVKAVTDKLKTDFINSLALELPATSAGDND